MWQQKERLAQLKIKVMVITFEPLGLGDGEMFSCYYDRNRTLYHHYGMLKAGFWDLWGPRTWWVYLRLLMKGRKIIQSQGDIHQRGGDVLIDPIGRVRFHHIANGPADRQELENIFKLAEAH